MLFLWESLKSTGWSQGFKELCWLFTLHGIKYLTKFNLEKGFQGLHASFGHSYPAAHTLQWLWWRYKRYAHWSYGVCTVVYVRLKNSDSKRYYSVQALLPCLTVTANIPLFIAKLCCWSFLVYTVDFYLHTLYSCHSFFSFCWGRLFFLFRELSRPSCFNPSPGNFPQLMEDQDRLGDLLANPGFAS